MYQSYSQGGTMTSLQNLTLELMDNFKRLYFEKRDIGAVLELLDDHITWIGTGTHSMHQSKEEIKDYLEAEFGTQPNGFLVTASTFHTSLVSDTVCVAFGNIVTAFGSPSINKISEYTFCLSSVCTYHNDTLKITHVQLTALGANQQTGDCYNTNGLRGEMQQQSKNLELQNQNLQAFIENIPGGVQQFLNDEFFTIVMVSDGFVSMFGYSREEVRELFHNRFILMIHPDDRKRVLEETHRQLLQSRKIELEYRVRCKSGKEMWVLDNGQLIEDKSGNKQFYCTIVDITNTRTISEELRLSLERYQLIMDQTNDIIFEWNLINDILTVSPKWIEKFGYLPMSSQMSSKLFKSDKIHRKDISKLEQLVRKIKQGGSYHELELRIYKIDGKYLWCKMRATTLFSTKGEPIRIIGVIADIDKEKRYSQMLLEKAQIDGLTGIYNKSAAETQIENFLADGKESVNTHALFIIDIDNFKKANDTLGHLFGDAVLTDVSKKLLNLFHSSDVIGRIGGDEFIVFMKHVPSDTYLKSKADHIQKAFQEITDFRGYPITCSIGCALFPQDAESYRGLFRNADLALYRAKSEGKDCFYMYNPSLSFHFFD